MSLELVTYGADRRLLIGAAEAIRSPIYTTDWTRMRIGFQGSFDAQTSNITGTPYLIAGACSGTTNVLVASSATHVLGYRFLVATMTYNAGPPSYFTMSLTGASGSGVYRKVGTTVTSATENLTRYFSNATSVRNGIFLEIEKSSPNYFVRMCMPSTTAGAQTDLTDAVFSTAMEVDLFSGITTVLPSTYAIGATYQIACNETPGSLNNIFIYWPRTSHKFSFNVRHRKMA